MGEVYGAYYSAARSQGGAELLHETGLRGSPTARERLLREAKAIARLSHPNVVVVHDAGTMADLAHGDRVFLAMEFIEGETLSAWLAAAPRSWQAIRDVFVAAGQGLAAAHGAGLVHRDFKPQNVMVGRDGSVRVMDFGLASGASGGQTAAGPLLCLDDLDRAPTSETIALTGSGVLLGTPLYMAPEQLEARPTDARTDQFSFCVALYEALYGERPFPSESFSVLFEAVIAGRVRPAPQKARVPAFLRKLLLRGLDPDPAARYASMEILIEALGHNPIRRRRASLIAAAMVGVAFAGVVGMQRLPAAVSGSAAARATSWREAGSRRRPVSAGPPSTVPSWPPAWGWRRPGGAFRAGSTTTAATGPSFTPMPARPRMCAAISRRRSSICAWPVSRVRAAPCGRSPTCSRGPIRPCWCTR